MQGGRGDALGAHAKKITSMLLAAAIWFVAVMPCSFAVAQIPVLETDVTDDKVILYLRGAVEGQKVKAQIGTELVGEVEIRPLDDSVPIVTWLLMDNSLSIAKADREKANQLLTHIVAGRAANEKITLCTISDHLHILAKESQNYAELKGQIDAIQHEDQETYLTDVLDELLNEEAQRSSLAYVRCVVISDGVDNNPGGITREELTKRLTEYNIPIYTFGCKGEDGALKAMYALSRQTMAKNWALEEISDTLSTVSVLSTTEIPTRTVLTIPEMLRDGTRKGVRLSFADGAVAETQVVMPFGTITQSSPKPVGAPKPDSTSEPESEPIPSDEGNLRLILFVAAGVLVLATIGVCVFLLVRKSKEKNRVKPVSEGTPGQQKVEVGATVFLEENSRQSSDTMILVGNEHAFMLSLTDIGSSERHYEVPLRSKVTIGRDPSNQVVIDYDNSVSGFHCEISASGNMLTIRDLNSRNGTFVDGVRVVDAAEITNGCVIKLGRVELRVVAQ